MHEQRTTGTDAPRGYRREGEVVLGACGAVESVGGAGVVISPYPLTVEVERHRGRRRRPRVNVVGCHQERLFLEYSARAACAENC